MYTGLGWTPIGRAYYFSAKTGQMHEIRGRKKLEGVATAEAEAFFTWLGGERLGKVGLVASQPCK